MTIIQTDNFGYNDIFRSKLHENSYNYPMHMHQHVEAVIVLDGELEITTDCGTELARAGDIALIPPFAAHGFSTPEKSTVWIALFSRGFFDGFAQPSLSESGVVFRADECVFEYMKTKMVYNDKKTPISIRAALFALLEEYTCKKSSAPKKAQSTILPLLFGYLEEHFREELTLSDVAMALGYSESYISHSLSKICGMNFSSLVSGIRIEEAKRLLVTTSLPISSVALESGFGTERSFHRAFSKLVGMTPSRYKEGKETK